MQDRGDVRRQVFPGKGQWAPQSVLPQSLCTSDIVERCQHSWSSENKGQGHGMTFFKKLRRLDSEKHVSSVLRATTDSYY